MTPKAGGSWWLSVLPPPTEGAAGGTWGSLGRFCAAGGAPSPLGACVRARQRGSAREGAGGRAVAAWGCRGCSKISGLPWTGLGLPRRPASRSPRRRPALLRSGPARAPMWVEPWGPPPPQTFQGSQKQGTLCGSGAEGPPASGWTVAGSDAGGGAITFLHQVGIPAPSCPRVPARRGGWARGQ